MTRWILALLICAGVSAQAQQQSLAGRLDSSTARAVQHLIDSVRALGVPSEPLVAKALEGATKRATPERILETVRLVAASLAEARATLGPSARQDELVAGGNILRAGVTPEGLRRLRQARAQGALTIPLVVLADLVARGVPADQGVTLIAAACRSGVADADLLLVRDRVRSDIQAGAGAAAAAELRFRGISVAELRRSPLVLLPHADVTLDPRAMQLRPALYLEKGPRSLYVEGFASAAQSELRYSGFDASAASRVELRGAWSAEFVGRAQHGVPAGRPAELRWGAATRLYFYGDSAGAWIGAGTRQAARDGQSDGGPVLSGGGWRRIGGMDMRLEVEDGALPFAGESESESRQRIGDSIAIVRSDERRDPPVVATAARFSLHVPARWTLDLSGGVTRGGPLDARRWGQANVSVQLSSLITFLAGAGTRGPDDFREGTLGGPFVRFGMRLAPWRPGAERGAALAWPAAAGVRFELTPGVDGRPVLRVWAPGAHLVELAGDMTGWSPASLERQPSGWWNLEVALSPGLYHLNMRIDGGAWLPPPGLTTAGDGFGGLVGVVVIQ